MARKKRVPGCQGARDTKISGRAPTFLNLGAQLATNEKVRLRPFIYPGTDILDRAPEFLCLGARLASNKNC